MSEALDRKARNPTAPTDAASCPCCARTVTQTIYHVPGIPAHSCVLLDTPEAARAFPRRDLTLAFCEACGFLFNRDLDRDVVSYSTDFEESQHFSGTFNAFARNLAKEIAGKCRLRGKRVLEIGCGKGEFLAELCRVGGATGLGIDPGYRADEGRGTQQEGLEFIVAHFGPEYAHLRADVVLCRHTLEHIPDVAEFVRSIGRMADSDETWVVFETPDAKRVLEEAAFWDIYYEHCSYFSPGTHARLFRQEGFEVTDLALAYDDQYIVQYARRSAEPLPPASALEDDLDEMRRLCERFPRRVREVRDAWRDRIVAAHADGKAVYLWGGGSKAVSFLTTLGLGEEVRAAVDVNPYKQGKFTPGTGHPVIAPEALRHRPPDLVVVMNPIYLDEIGKSLGDLGLYPEILAV